MLMLVKDFAAQQGVGVAVVYKHLKNHREELEGLVIKKPKQTLLTDEAQEYLKGIMLDRTVLSVTDVSMAAQITELQAENKRLLEKLATVQDSLAAVLIELGEQKALAATAQSVERERDAAREQISQLTRSQEKDQELIQEVTLELDRLRRRSLWQRIFNR